MVAFGNHFLFIVGTEHALSANKGLHECKHLLYVINYFINFLTAKSYKNSRHPYKTVIRFFVREFIKHPSVKPHLPFHLSPCLKGTAELALLKQSSFSYLQTARYFTLFYNGAVLF